MLTLSKKVSLLSAIIFGISVVVANRAVADVSQLLDIKQTDSMSQSTSSQAEQDGCPNGVSDRIDTGSPPLSQYDAAGRNACPTQVEQHNRRSDRATTKALTVTQHQLETLRSHLERLRMRLDRLDGGLDAEKKQ